MYHNERCIAIVPARGGSKAIPRKNLANFCGRPLIEWTIATAIESALIDRIIVSTDDDEIASVATSAGAEVMYRPESLARDESLVIDAVRDLIAKLRLEEEVADVFLLLEPTSPLRNVADIDQCIQLLVDRCFDSVATFCECEHHPNRAWKIEDGVIGSFVPDSHPWLPRQALPKAYRLNGAVYCFRTSVVHDSEPGFLGSNPGSVIMSAERSLDIDSELDLKLAELIKSQ